MPLSDFWGIKIDRSVSGQVTLTLDDLVRTIPWDGGKATSGDLNALFTFLNEYVALKEIPSETIWDYRTQYARFARDVLAMQELIATLPGNQRKPWQDKLALITAQRDKYRALSGE